MPTALDLITGALTDLQVYGAGETPSNEDGVVGLTVLNQMADALGIERLMLFEILRTVKTLAANTASYTIGSGGSINIVRPTRIQDAMLVLDMTASPSTEVPLSVLSEGAYAAWAHKSQTSSRPTAIYYDHKWAAGLGTIYPLPIPDIGTTQLVLYTPKEAVSQFADLNATSYTFPPSLELALRKNLALHLAPMHHTTPSPLLEEQARESKANFKRGNVRFEPIQVDPALTPCSGGRWNINTDSYR